MSAFPSTHSSSLYRQDVSSSSGGLLIYIRADLPQRRLDYAEINEHGIESLCMEVTVGKTTIVLACIYKHLKLKTMLLNVICQIWLILYLGLTVILYSSETRIVVQQRVQQYKIFVKFMGLLITEPTCHKGDVSTLIDVILVTNPRRYLGTLNSEYNISDFHNIIGAATRRFAPSLKPQKIIYPSYKSFNDADFLFDLQCAPFHVMYIFDDADDMAWYTSTFLSDVIDSHAPVKSKFVK